MILQSQEQFIGTVDVWQLRQVRWPFMRLLARHFVEEVELGRYMRRLLATGHWSAVRVVPRAHPAQANAHVFDVYGQPRRENAPIHEPGEGRDA